MFWQPQMESNRKHNLTKYLMKAFFINLLLISVCYSTTQPLHGIVLFKTTPQKNFFSDGQLGFYCSFCSNWGDFPLIPASGDWYFFWGGGKKHPWQRHYTPLLLSSGWLGTYPIQVAGSGSGVLENGRPHLGGRLLAVAPVSSPPSHRLPLCKPLYVSSLLLLGIQQDHSTFWPLRKRVSQPTS